MPRYRVLQTPVFESLVDELMDGLDDGNADVLQGATSRLHGTPLWSIDSTVTESLESPRPSRYCAQDYAVDPPTPPSDLPADVESIFVELGLRPGLTADQIAQIRRQFALRYHPDKLPIELRKNATERMMIANALCDAYPLTSR